MVGFLTISTTVIFLTRWVFLIGVHYLANKLHYKLLYIISAISTVPHNPVTLSPINCSICYNEQSSGVVDPNKFIYFDSLLAPVRMRTGYFIYLTLRVLFVESIYYLPYEKVRGSVKSYNNIAID